MDVLKSQQRARDGQPDMSRLPPPRPRSEASAGRSQSLYAPGGLDEHLGRSSAAAATQEVDSILPPPGGGGGPGYTSSLLNSADLPSAGVAAQEAAGSRRTSMNPGGGGMLPDASLMTRGDSLMRGADRGSTPMRQSARGGSKPPPAPDFSSIPSATLNDRFSHYNRPPSRPPSRDRSVDRFASRGQTPVPPELINPRSRAPSAQRSTAQDWTPDSGVYDDEAAAPAGGSRRPSRPASIISGEAPALTGNGSVGGGFPVPYAIPSSPQEAESLLRKRACGQEIPPCPPTPGQGTVKRTESLYINPIVRRQAQVKVSPPPSAAALPQGGGRAPEAQSCSRIPCDK